jgi:hypothetical protein
MITESLLNDTLWFLWECFCLRIFLSIEMNRYNDYWTVITIHWAEALFLLFKLNFSWPIQLSLSFTKRKPNAVLIKLLYPSTSLGSCALVHLQSLHKTQTRQIVKFKIVLQIDKSKKILSVTISLFCRFAKHAWVHKYHIWCRYHPKTSPPFWKSGKMVRLVNLFQFNSP